MLAFPDFLQVVKNAPLVSIDLIVQNEAGKYLLGMRRNEPAKGCWFVPGGRIHKNETLSQAFKRISQVELGIHFDRHRAAFHGVYEHFYETNAGDEPGLGTHYIVLAHSLRVSGSELILPELEQHQSWRWMSTEEIRADEVVSKFSRDYFV